VGQIRVEWVRYGREAAQALHAAISEAKAGEPLRPVTVIVPSNHVGVASRRMLAQGRLGPVCASGVGLAAVTFATPYRMAELLGAPRLAGTGRRPVSTPVIAAAVRAVLNDEAGLFSPVAEHPATESALVATYRELRDVSEEALEAVGNSGRRAADVVRIHRAVRASLASSWYDEQDLMQAAATELRKGHAGAGELGSVVVHLPQRLSRHAGALLAATAEVADVVVLAGTTGDARADDDIVTSVRRMSGVTSAPPTSASAVVVGTQHTSFVTASDADDEVRAAVREVVEAVHSGVTLDRIAIFYASPEPYARLVHEHLDAAGIAVNGSSTMPLTARVAGRSLLRLLALPALGYRRQDVFAWMAASPLLHHGRPAPVTAWERLSREAGIVAGRHEWDELLTTRTADLDQRADELADDPDAESWRIERPRADAQRARELRAFVLGMIDDLSAAAGAPRLWGEHARWARKVVDRLHGTTAQRGEWPDVEARATEQVELAIDRLGALDAVEGLVGLDVFARTLELELETDLGRVGRFGEGVLAGSVGMGVGLDLELVVILGLAEGSFPAVVRDDSLLPDRERAMAHGELALHRSRVDREHRELLATLAGAQRHLLCVPRGDLRRSSERVASRWALELASSMAGQRWWSRDLMEAGVPWARSVPSFDAGLRHLTLPATVQEHRLRSLMAAGAGRHDPAALKGVDDPVLMAGATVVAGRRSPQFTRFDGNLGRLAVPSPVASSTSATALERWAGCPFAYLLHDVLGVSEVDNPEEALSITPLDRGRLVHSALERFLLEVLARPATDQPDPDDAWTAADERRLLDIAEQLFVDYEARGLTGRPIFWTRERRRILTELQRALSVDNDYRRQHRTRPLAAELGFGVRGAELGVVPLTLADGRQLWFRGKADRVDIAEDGSIHVVDYKTGKSKYVGPLTEDEPDQRGRKLQLVVYGAAARVHRELPAARVHANYWFISGPCTDRIGYEVTAEVLDKVTSTLGIVVAGVEAGIFPAHPTQLSTATRVDCRFCDPDGLGVGDLYRQWNAKRRDPAFARYADLAEPLVDVEPDAEELTSA